MTEILGKGGRRPSKLPAIPSLDEDFPCARQKDLKFYLYQTYDTPTKIDENKLQLNICNL
jgi:hypothetical protein